MENKLEERRKAAEEQFEILVKQKEEHQAEINGLQDKINQADTEMVRLQGEYRLINDLQAKPKNASKEADKLEIKGVDDGKTMD